MNKTGILCLELQRGQENKRKKVKKYSKKGKSMNKFITYEIQMGR